jgi:hypothetical protein
MTAADEARDFFAGLRREMGIGDDAVDPGSSDGEDLGPVIDVDPVPSDSRVETEVSSGPGEGWDSNARYYRIRGQRRVFYPISSLARALNRKTITIRKWEESGVLPEAQFRTPGEGKSQHRLYTREQILGLVEIAADCGILDASKRNRINQTNFTERAFALFESLVEE